MCSPSNRGLSFQKVLCLGSSVTTATSGKSFLILSGSGNTPLITSLVILYHQWIWKPGERRRAEVGFRNCRATPSPNIWKITQINPLNLTVPLHINMKNFYHSIPDLEQCGTPREIQDGDFILSSTSGKLVAQYSCYHGFKLKGPSAIVCEGNRWSDQPPQCTGTWTIFAIDLFHNICLEWCHPVWEE